jgi:hypothetical protein
MIGGGELALVADVDNGAVAPAIKFEIHCPTDCWHTCTLDEVEVPPVVTLEVQLAFVCWHTCTLLEPMFTIPPIFLIL